VNPPTTTSPKTEVRFASRRREMLRRRWRRVLALLLGIVLVGTVVWIVGFSSVLAVRSVSVDGETTLKEQQIRSAAAVRIGQPLARVDTVGIEARVASMERIQAVSVSRVWPHTVRIQVLERVPLMFTTSGGQFRGIDRFGIDFRSFDKAPKGLIAAQVGVADARSRQQTLEAVASVIDFITRKDPALRGQVQGVSASSKDSIVFDLTKGRTVTWGSKASSARKLQVLKSLLNIKARAYDVGAPDQPTTRK